jgi:hypothetical protein
LTKSFNLSKDQVRVGFPHKGLGISIPLIQVGEHGLFQLSDCSMAASSHAAFGHLGEQALNEI